MKALTTTEVRTAEGAVIDISPLEWSQNFDLNTWYAMLPNYVVGKNVIGNVAYRGSTFRAEVSRAGVKVFNTLEQAKNWVEKIWRDAPKCPECGDLLVSNASRVWKYFHSNVVPGPCDLVIMTFESDGTIVDWDSEENLALLEREIADGPR